MALDHRARFGAKLREIRERSHLSIRELGSLIGKSHTFISYIENGRAQPDGETLWHLARALKVDFNELANAATNPLYSRAEQLGRLLQRSPIDISLLIAHTPPSAFIGLKANALRTMSGKMLGDLTEGKQESVYLTFEALRLLLNNIIESDPKQPVGAKLQRARKTLDALAMVEYGDTAAEREAIRPVVVALRDLADELKDSLSVL